MVRLEVDVCDVCQDPRREAEPAEVTLGAETGSGVLCEEHSAALREVLRAFQGMSQPPVRPARKAPQKRSQGQRRGRSIKSPPVLTEEQARKLGV